MKWLKYIKKSLKYMSFVLFWTGFGIALHDACHHLYLIGGYKEILSAQGLYVGFLLMILGYLLIVWKYDDVKK